MIGDIEFNTGNFSRKLGANNQVLGVTRENIIVVKRQFGKLLNVGCLW